MRLQAGSPRVILASGSAARAALLRAAGVHFDVQPAAVDEAGVKLAARAEGASAAEVAVLLAQMKAERVARREPDALVIGADQLLVCDDEWFDKPADLADARAQLRRLRGRAHVLATAVVCQRGGARVWHHVALPRLVMQRFSAAFLEDYLALEAGEVTASVGGYRFEGLGMQLFDSLAGEQAAVLGLPMLALLGFLRQHEVLVD